MKHDSILGEPLVLENLSKHYGPVIAADGVNLTVAPGEFLTLLGPSGSGKTTVLMAIAGFVDPSAGRILLGRRDITALAPEDRNFGMVFQGYALFPHMTVWENVAFPLMVRRRPMAERRTKVGRALDLVQLGHLADRRPAELSGGQQQRVALARAMAFEPDLLLLDEPLSALDKKLRSDLQSELRALHARVGLTFVYVTHDQDEALSMSQRVAIMRDGKLVQAGSPSTLYDRPVTRFVADFLGRSNFIEANVMNANNDTIDVAVGPYKFAVASDGAALRHGGTAVIAIRPEKITVGQAGASRLSIEGRVTDLSYYGAHSLATVEVPGLGSLVAIVPEQTRGSDLCNGAVVSLDWSIDAPRVVNDE